MPRYPVLQPDGKLAVWSTIVDKFLGFDYTVQQAMEWLADRYENTPESFEYECVSVAAGVVPDFMQDWAHNAAWALYLHGPDDKSVKLAMERTTDAMTRRYIEQFVMTCKAESRADEAVERAETAEKRIDGWLEVLATERQRAEAAEAMLAELRRYVSIVDWAEAEQRAQWKVMAKKVLTEHAETWQRLADK